MTTTLRNRHLVLLFAILLAPPTVGAAEEPRDGDGLSALLEEVWETRLREFPQFATRTGEHRYNDRLSEVSLAATERRAEQSRA